MTSQTPKNDFDTIMSDTTRDMSRYERTFSQFIHRKGISSASNLLASTIGRPNALLFGAVCSFTLTLTVYLLSKNLGYSLSGFESIGAFIFGWTIGILFDVMPSIFRKRK